VILAFHAQTGELILFKFNHSTPKHLGMEQSMAVTLWERWSRSARGSPVLPWEMLSLLLCGEVGTLLLRETVL
jgi:hypothetical protein